MNPDALRRSMLRRRMNPDDVEFPDAQELLAEKMRIGIQFDIDQRIYRVFGRRGPMKDVTPRSRD